VTTIDTPSSLLSDRLARLRTTWPGGAWDWDGRFGCALSTVGKAQEASAREALAAVLPSVWTAARLAEAPMPIQELCARVGGMRGEQLVLSAELVEGALAYCLWWPWGSGANFSARVGATSGGDDLSPVVRSALGIK
jgi:hypothetical protein